MEAIEMSRTACVLMCAAAALLFAACGGGGGGGGSIDVPVVSTPTPTTGDTTLTEQQLVVVRYDFDGDDNPDVLTLDRTESPLTIVEALKGTATGDAVDVTASWAGQAIDSSISDAINSQLISTFSVGGETNVYVTDNLGHESTVTIFE